MTTDASSLRIRCALAASIVGVATFGAERVAQAEETTPAFTIGARPIWYLLGGVTGGLTTVAHDRGGFVGGELSAARLSHGGRWIGAYGDGYYDFGAQRGYVTLGPELGYKMFGVDAGGAARLGGDRVELGPTGRLFVTLGVLSIYGRYAYFADALGSGDKNVVQIGALLKMPLAVWGLQ
jgi:hypothetical protein